ncbi:hypothetical protein N8718_05795 [Luminiphilus sp.]|nr:hypothetical protein [Luminiphilus sp.]MDA8590555.1 hypothetical protein [Luminiphilus sp.]MDA8739495.1 hypothetical protein [Luminiphilus sp.]MDB2441080.1 hypothetical protein [Luminiphilus sp.]MDB2511339.1 hypothetical protein [Luminiphilus sp.]
MMKLRILVVITLRGAALLGSRSFSQPDAIATAITARFGGGS